MILRLELIIPEEAARLAFQARVKAALTDPNLRIRNSMVGRLAADRTIGLIFNGYSLESGLYVCYYSLSGIPYRQKVRVCGISPDKRVYPFDTGNIKLSTW